MRTRTFGRTGRAVSELGIGMWGMGGGIGGWTGADDRQSVAVLQAAVDAGVTVFDSAQVYGAGHSDQLLGALARANPGRDLFLASKIPPKSREWPARPGDRIRDAFPPDHIRSSVEGILRQMRMDSLDLVQFHVWQDEWADDEGWQLAADRLKRDGLVRLVGISVNRREPANVLRTLRTGRIDAVQVVYNIFDQAPEDELFPLCRELGVAVIARVPLDEGSLADMLTLESRWPEADWRNSYFGRANLEANIVAAASGPLPAALLAALREHRWDRPQSRASRS
jgi:aryl-alcohol dehydrogenase-like predicted oxidoreductase